MQRKSPLTTECENIVSYGNIKRCPLGHGALPGIPELNASIKANLVCYCSLQWDPHLHSQGHLTLPTLKANSQSTPSPVVQGCQELSVGKFDMTETEYRNSSHS